MIPLARIISQKGHRVYIGAGEKHAALFRAELPDLSFINFPGFSPGYSRFLPQYFAMLLKSPILLFHIISEHRRLGKIIKEHDIDIVISDNRFGLWNKSVTTVYVTHILRIPLPAPLRIFEIIGVILQRYIINKFDHCIIPDLPGEYNLSGRLSHNIRLPANTRYTGILSRFDVSHSNSGSFDFPHNTIILSGPEPQRGILRMKLVKALENESVTTIILEGQPEKDGPAESKGNIISYPHLASHQLAELLKTSRCIISRSGYTTIMDLVFLKRSAFLIPTPGQTEQEYLAEFLSAKECVRTTKQKEIGSVTDFSSPRLSVPDELISESKKLLDSFLNELLEEMKENQG